MTQCKPWIPVPSQVKSWLAAILPLWQKSLSMQHLQLKWKTLSQSSTTYSLYHSWKPPSGAKIQQVGCHQAAYQEHLKEQATKSSQRAQAEQNMLLSWNTTPMKFCGPNLNEHSNWHGGMGSECRVPTSNTWNLQWKTWTLILTQPHLIDSLQQQDGRLMHKAQLISLCGA